MTLNRYTYPLADDIKGDNDFTVNIGVGNELYICRFLWSIVTQEQYNKLEETLAVRADTDPLTDGTTFDRTYDWLTYLAPLITMTEEEFTEWYNTQTMLPQSWRNKPVHTIYINMMDEKDEVLELTDYRTLLQESLNWQVEIHHGDETLVTTVRLGGWVDYDTGKAFRFVAPGYTVIGKDELQYVTMEFDINE